MTDLATLIAQYHPDEQVASLVQSAKIALLVGISGAGKDTIKKKLLSDSDFQDIVSHTTRLPRINNRVAEVPDVDYHFISEADAQRMLEDHEFIEAKFVHGTVYGTSIHELEKASEGHKIALTDIDVQGVEEYKRLANTVVAIFILPPSYTVWRERLAHRYETEAAFKAEWDTRRQSAISELEHALEVPYYHFIINDEIDRAVQIADDIAHQPDVFHRKDDEARLRARDLLAAIQTSL